MLQEFAQQVEKTARDVVNNVHTALPGRIESFNSATGMAVVRPIGQYVTSDKKRLDFPLVSDVPVCFPASTSISAGMAFPVKSGDNCLIIVSEIELDQWRTGAESEGVLKFDLTNAIAIPGLMKSGNILIQKACDNEAVVINAGGSEIMLSKAGIAISGNLTITGSVECSGNINCTGNAELSGDVKAGSISLKGHTHSEYHGQTSSPNG